MSPDLIAAAILAGPAAITAPVLYVAGRRQRAALDEAAAILAEHRPQTESTGPDGPPEGGGYKRPRLPSTAGSAGSADVIAFPTRRAA
ncbi:hypothetical protein [Actinacidiphila glaucinigra]|uniref:hypothetical protein n=1 Tax=Actinacidiphila glaucinigra TaxID=235986 RepID=UPI003716DF23